MLAEPLPPLLDRRLIIVTGKGGTGKTTVAAALAVAAARQGRTVLVAEVGGQAQIPQRIRPEHAIGGETTRDLLPGLTALQIDPFDALAEYLGLQTHLRGVVDLVFRSRSFTGLLEAAPGWRELITLGKLWHLAQQQNADGAPLYDLIVVDAPSTGHGLTFLDVPRVVGSAVRAGPLRAHARRVEELVRDPARTLLLPVTLAEELPALETLELLQRAREEVGVAVDRVIANAVMPDPLPEPLPCDLEARLRSLGDNLTLGSVPAPSVLAACSGHLSARHRLNLGYVEQLRRRCDAPIVTLPYRPGDVSGAEALSDFAQPLLAARATP